MGVRDVPAFVAQLARQDAEDLARARAGEPVGVGPGGPVVEPADGGDWPPELEDQLATATVDELRRTHVEVEVYYGTAIRRAAGTDLEDYWLRLAYRRIINLLMRFMDDMGFSQQELSFVLRVLQRSGAGASARVLEVGCGGGSLLLALADNGYRNLHGIDFAPAAVARARARAAERQLDVRVDQATMADLLAAGEAGSYDLVMICDVLEHIPVGQVDGFLAEIHQLLAPSGTLLVVTPNRLNGPHDITQEVVRPGGEATGLHLREYTLAQVRALLATAGFGQCSAALFTGAGPAAPAVGVSRASIAVKLAIEPVLRLLPFGVRSPVIDAMYFKAVAVQKQPAGTG